jgi:enamine deaminase RidA (YjgF/YER057c/UK114 family)
MNIESKLHQLQIQLPPPPQAGGNYLPFRRTGNLVFLSGVISISGDGRSYTGQVGQDRDLDEGYAAARLCALNALAVIRFMTGDLNSVKQFLYLGGYVNAIPAYGQSPSVINGASDLLEALYGEAGLHARAAVAVAGLPKNATVEIQVNLELH